MLLLQSVTLKFACNHPILRKIPTIYRSFNSNHMNDVYRRHFPQYASILSISTIDKYVMMYAKWKFLPAKATGKRSPFFW
jgi:hypothetical protein